MASGKQLEEDETIGVERCTLFLRRGFTTIAMAANDQISRLASLRKGDYQSELDEGAAPMFLVEIYNTLSMPVMFMERCVAIHDAVVESLAWLGNNVFVSCADGSLRLISAFTTEYQRFQICASPILALSPISHSRLALATGSSELIIVKYAAGELSEDNSWKRCSVEVKRRFKFSSDETITSLAVSNELCLAAVGMINFIYLVNLRRGNDAKLCIELPRQNVDVVVWSLLFLEGVLFAGDSRGRVTIYEAINGVVLKVISSHQADVLALASNGNDVYASGVDHRIQVIGAPSPDKKFGWTTVGQRLFHENDVRAMVCVGERWLVSGGAEHEIAVSDQRHTLCHPTPQRACSTSLDGDLVLMRYPHFLELWAIPIVTRKGDTATGPKKLARINSSFVSATTNSYIGDASLSPDGHYIAFTDANGLNVLRVRPRTRVMQSAGADLLERLLFDGENLHEDEDGEAEDEGNLTITSLLATNKAIYYSLGQFTLKRLDLAGAQVKTRARLGRGGGGVASSLRQLHVDAAERLMIALDTNSRVYKFTLIVRSDAAEAEPEQLDIHLPVIDCALVNDSLAVFLCSELEQQHLCLYNISAGQMTRTLGKTGLGLGFNEYLCCLSNVSDEGSMAATSNKGNFLILTELSKQKPALLMVDRAEDHLQGKERSKKRRKRTDHWIEPFWGRKNSGLLLVEFIPSAQPSKVPMLIKRYERN